MLGGLSLLMGNAAFAIERFAPVAQQLAVKFGNPIRHCHGAFLQCLQLGKIQELRKW
jgi:hypothetical protein